ncbi:MAG TPA: hypothetical protein VIP46_02910 [Pyrinomonadaceae bacterium]
MEFELVREAERELMPALYDICQSLRSELPDAKVRVFSSTGGTATPNPWHLLGVACRLPDLPDRMVEAQLTVDLSRLNSAPALDAYVMWDWATIVGTEANLGDEVEQVEARLFARPVPASDEALQMVKASLPLLVGPLKSAVRRGFPRRKGTPDPHPSGRAGGGDKE